MHGVLFALLALAEGPLGLWHVHLQMPNNYSFGQHCNPTYQYAGFCCLLIAYI